MKIKNCKVNVPKMYEMAIESIERVKEDGIYILKLKEGFKFTWGNEDAIVHTQKDLIASFKDIDIPEKLKANTTNSPKNKSAKKSDAPKKPRKARVKKVVVIKSKVEQIDIVMSFLKGTKTVKELNSQYSIHTVEKTLKKYDLKNYNYANFAGLNNSKIFATLRLYNQKSIIELLEESYNVANMVG